MARVKECVNELSGKSFEEKIKRGTVLVDFFAEWCLAPKTKLLLNPCIKNIEDAKEGIKILSFDDKFNEEITTIKSSHKIIHDKQIRITTERGREIVCTPEHLLLSESGFLMAKDIKQENLLATYLLSSYPEIEEDERVFLTEKLIRDNAEKYKLNKEKYISELKEKGLVELKYSDEKAHILASLIGMILSDGCLSIQKNNERVVEFFVAKDEDAKELNKDLMEIGFEASIRKQSIKGKINQREFMQNIIRMRVAKTSLFMLLSSLDGIIGEKFIKGIKIPKWILDGPKGIKKAFLQGFLGGDGSKVNIVSIKRKKFESYNKAIINPLEFHFYSGAENSVENFGNELANLLKEFDVKIAKVEVAKEDRYERKDKKESLLLKIRLNSDLGSVYNYSCIGFKYSLTKKMISSIAKEYLMERIAKIRERREKRLQAISMKDKFSANEIAKTLCISASVINNWINGKDAKASHDSMDYKSWQEKYIKGKISYDKVKDIEKIEDKNQEFISLSLNNATKMFVANDIIHHNCMPCLMMAPVIEEMAEKFTGKIDFCKINIDENASLAEKFSVMSIPTLIVFKNGKEVDRLVGSLPADVLEEKLRKFV